jgi:hypothetical protein
MYKEHQRKEYNKTLGHGDIDDVARFKSQNRKIVRRRIVG